MISLFARRRVMMPTREIIRLPHSHSCDSSALHRRALIACEGTQSLGDHPPWSNIFIVTLQRFLRCTISENGPSQQTYSPSHVVDLPRSIQNASTATACTPLRRAWQRSCSGRPSARWWSGRRASFCWPEWTGRMPPVRTAASRRNSGTSPPHYAKP